MDVVLERYGTQLLSPPNQQLHKQLNNIPAGRNAVRFLKQMRTSYQLPCTPTESQIAAVVAASKRPNAQGHLGILLPVLMLGMAENARWLFTAPASAMLTQAWQNAARSVCSEMRKSGKWAMPV